MKYCVTGCAGFIGSHLVDELLENGHKVIGIDNLSTGKLEFLKNVRYNPNFSFHNKDLSFNKDYYKRIMEKCDLIFHLSAHADIKNNINNTEKCIKQNITVTYNILESMKDIGVNKIVFSSTGSVYGETNVIPTSETTMLYPQTSIYSASKLSGEALIQGYSETFGFTGYIFRFVSVLGPRYHHGHVYDFYNQLKSHPDYLNVLGDGTQTKSYLHVYDCVKGILTAIYAPAERINIYNLGTDETIKLKQSVQEIIDFLKIKPIIQYGKEKKGWIGDNPLIYLDCSKIKSLGWKPKYTIKDGIIDTLKYLKENNI